MLKNEVRSPVREVRLRVATFFALIMLSCDSLNPVKIVCGVLGLDTIYLTLIFLIIFVGIIAANAKELTYFMVKVFFHSILSIFFSSMEVLGRENIPQHGPVIFTGNHMNQFVDGAVLLITTPQRVGFLVAEKSYNSRLIGDLAKAMGSIPVSRPQDKAKAGPGKMKFEGLRVIGDGTKFTALVKGDKIRPGRSAEAYRIKEVISDTEGVLAEDHGEASPMNESFAQGQFTTYEILAHVDQSQMFEKVQSALANGQNLGIFPEGGSHDRTDLLPLKAGVAAIALGVMEKYGMNVPIVPVGLNYFKGHKFRGRVVVEYGAPIIASEEMFNVYKTSKRAGYQALLQQVEDGMRSVIITASDYNELKLIHTARRLYQQSSASVSTKTKQDLARRFSVGWKIVKEKYTDHQKLPEDIAQLVKELEQYQDTLDHWGLRDYQLQSSASFEMPTIEMVYMFFHGATVLILASIPSLLLNMPVGAAANYWAEKEAKKDLQASRVKLAARDVLLSKKIMFSMVAVPVLWLTYALLMLAFSSFKPSAILLVTVSFPIFSYIGVMAVEVSMMDLKDLRPAFLRLLPDFRQQVPELLKLRANLSKKVRDMVKKYGPELGPIYLDVSSAWEKEYKKSVASTTLQKIESNTDIQQMSVSKMLNNITTLSSNEEDVSTSNKVKDA